MDRPRRPPTRSNPSRAAKLKVPIHDTRSNAAYFNSLSYSSDNGSHDDGDDVSERALPTTRKRKNHDNDYSPSPRKVLRRSYNSVQERPSKAISLRASNSTAATPIARRSTSTSHPPWPTLPYHVLLSVFDCVAAPIRNNSSRREDVSVAVSSLMSAALTCKDFAEPALTNLYKCPPFYHQWRYTKSPHTSLSQLIDTLNLPLSTTMFKYHPKVEILRLEVGSTLTQKNNANYLELQDVVQNLPRLSQVELYHDSDEPPYRKLDEHVRFKCAANELIQILAPVREADDDMGGKTARTELVSWRWNSRLTSESLSLDKLKGFHLNPSFASLRIVAFVNYQLPSWGASSKIQFSEEMQEQNTRRIDQLADCISVLPHLEHLILESSTLVSGVLLDRLPTTLKHLELINCWEVTADDLGDFLVTHGNNLHSLTLNHCQSLSLAFLPVLRSACPNLQHLYMDLSYFRHHEHYADNKPEYDTLLTEDQVPTWPSSLQSIEILHMRKWGRKAAETFFGSLLQSAPDLPHLRRLAFRIALDISWRQRLELREFWVDKMVKVFKRKARLPRGSKMLRPPLSEFYQQNQKELKPKSLVPAAFPMRRSARIAELSPPLTSSEGETTYLSKSELARASAVGRELKQLKGSGLLLKEHDADDEESEDELAADHSDRSRPDRSVRRISRHSPDDKEFIHSLCDVVDIQVDNHRPMERHFDMEDFLDSPEESDSDWDGGDADVFD
ncbi:hypothetical protein F4677DRAFT_445723 [Hypoxylon crocopeplum]|nr:hypothetical protein F4677DRAFT_445723 [Hypoxylon crocopeplum]